MILRSWGVLLPSLFLSLCSGVVALPLPPATLTKAMGPLILDLDLMRYELNEPFLFRS